MIKNRLFQSLRPYGCEEIVSMTNIPGPGSWVVVFADLGDYYTAFLTYDCQVIWVMNSGASEVNGCADDTNILHEETRNRNLRGQ